MEKEKILFKIRDYNNELEKILEKKSFSESTKNLLLSMLYKIETAYADYNMVKRETLNKNDYLETILRTIYQDCSKINLVKTGMEEAKILEEKNRNCEVKPEQNEILAYQNEISLLNAILEIGAKDQKLSIQEDLLKKPLVDFFRTGKLMEMLEVIQDFNGWSWNIAKDNRENETSKITYTSLIYLVGLETVIKVETQKDCVKFLKQSLYDFYGEELGEAFLNKLIQTILKEYAKKDEEYQKLLLEKEAYWKEELEKIENKPQFLENITKEKREMIYRVGEIDRILNNNQLLKETYSKVNQDLPIEKKYFSVSTFAETLEKERDQLLQKRMEKNKLLEPEEFIKKRNEIVQKAKFFQELNLQDISDESCFIKLQNLFQELFMVRLQKTEEKKDILNQIYELRYYFIQLKERELLEKLPQNGERLKLELIKKAIQMKLLNPISKQEQINEKIFLLIYDSKIVHLENMQIQVEEKETSIVVETFDEKVQEDTIVFEKLNWNEKNQKRRKIFD